MGISVGINVIKKDLKAQFWTIPGPFFIFCILLSVVLNDVTTPLILPLVAIIGAIASNLWKWRGVACSSAILALALVYALQSQTSQSWIWTISVTLSIATTFIITALCSEEAYHSWDKLNKGSMDHRQAISHLNECYQAAQQKFAEEQTEWSVKLNELEQQLAVKEEKQRSNEQLIRLAKAQITATLAKQEQLAKDLADTRQSNSAMKSKIRELEMLVDPEAIPLDMVKEKEELQNQLASSLAEIEQLQAQIEEAQLKEETALHQIEGLSQEILILKQTSERDSQTKLNEIQKKHAVVVDELTTRLEAALLENQANEKKYISEKQVIVEEVLKEKQTLENSFLRLQEEFEELSQQDQEKQQQIEMALITQKEVQDQLQKVSFERESLFQKVGEWEQLKKDNEVLQYKLEELMDIEQLNKDLQQQLKHQKQMAAIANNEKDELQEQLQQLLDKQAKIIHVQQKELQEQLEQVLSENEFLVQKNEESKSLKNDNEALQQRLDDYIDVEQVNTELRLLLKLQNQETEAAKEKIEQLQELLNKSAEVASDQQNELLSQESENHETMVNTRELRKAEGLYQQLREQFAEKSDILSQTRRELFATQEKLLAMQKENDEAAIDDDKETNESLIRLIAEAESELAMVEHQHSMEINHLHEVIESLMARG